MNPASNPIAKERLARLSPVKRALFEKWRAGTAAGGAASRTIPRRDQAKPIPLSFPQRRLWFFDQLEPGNPYYNIAAALRLVGPLDAGALELSLSRVVARHESLRTVFRSGDSGPQQIVLPSIPVAFERFDLSDRSPGQREAELERLKRDAALARFDLASGPLFRAMLVRLDIDEHVLFLTVHHIVADGWSMALLRDEMVGHYAAQLEGRAARLDPLPLDYADFAAWQTCATADEKRSSSLDLWLRQLANLPGPIELPLDRPRGDVQTFRGAVCRRSISEDHTGALRATSRDRRLTLYMTLLAAWQIVLARLSGQKDLCVGSPVAGRTHPRLEHLIGFFANTLVLRADLSKNPSVEAFLDQTRKTTLEAIGHQDVPFDQLVELLQPNRDLSRTPLFQSMFVLQNIPLGTRKADRLELTELSFDHAPVSQFDLTLNVDERSEMLDLSLVYNPDLFDPTSVERMLDCYEVVLTEMIADTHARVLDLPMVTSEERHRQLVAWNQTEAEIPESEGVHHLIEAQARRIPDAVALAGAGHHISYRQLEQRSNRLARYLQSREVSHEAIIAMCLPRGVEQIVTLLGILKSGCAYLPLDPDHPAARLTSMIEDSGATLVVAHREMIDCFAQATCPILCINELTAEISQYDEGPLRAREAGGDLAYLIYTSGSTGTPKGVEVEHRGLVNHALALADAYRLGPGDGMLQFLSLGFDAAAEEIFPALVSGATLHVPTNPEELFGAALLDWSRDDAVNVLHIPPPVWRSVLEEIERRGPESAAHLKSVLSGGDVLGFEELRAWHDATAGRVRFLYAYGVSEATITTTLYCSETQSDDAKTGRLPIGRPIQNNRVYVLDDRRQPVPIGVAGELYIGGVGLARGYHDRVELTSESFVTLSIEGVGRERLYRTGDLVKYRPDGSLEFLGRADQQLKVNGYRIEPGEIESAILRHQKVHEVAVVAREDSAGVKRLVAYVGADKLSDVFDEELPTFLADHLPRHMIPASIVAMERLPRLAGDKIDLRGLPEPRWSNARGQSEFIPPSSENEVRLADIWCEVLGVDRISVHDNFFELGGDSIQAIQVISKAAARQLHLTPKQLFGHQTIAELAPLARQAPSTNVEEGLLTGEVPLGPVQSEFISRDPVEPHYFNHAILFDVRPELRPNLVESAVHALFEHHDMLRARFESDEQGRWRQSISDGAGEDVFRRIDLSSINRTDLTLAIERGCAEIQASLDLSAGPIARFVYFDLGNAEPARLLFVVHHLVIDGVSWRVLIEDFLLACAQIVRGDAVHLAPKTSSFRQWTSRLHEYAQSDDLEHELDFWRQVGSASGESLTCDFDRGPDTMQASQEIARQLTVSQTDALLHEAPQAYRTDAETLMRAALARTLCEYTGASRIILDMEGHGREDLFDDLDVSRTVGWFTTLSPIVLEWFTNDNFATLIKNTKERSRAVPRRGLGYGVLRWLASDKTREMIASIPRRQVRFNYLGRLDGALGSNAPLTLAREDTGPTESPRAARPYIWDIVAWVRDQRLHIEWNYSANRHHSQTMQRLVDQFAETLGELIDHCLRPDAGGVTPSDFPLADVGQAELDRISDLLADTDRDA